MPADLFQSDVPSTPASRRASLLPVSVVTHVLVITAVVLGPMVAPGELPEPTRPLLYAVTEVTLPAPPPVARLEPQRNDRGNPDAAPVVTPTQILPEVMPPADYDDRAVDTGDFTGLLPPGGGGNGFDVSVDGLPPPPSPPKTERPIPVGGDIVPPRRLKTVPPLYPAIAQQARIQGEVRIEAVIGENGRVREARVTGGHEMLTGAALDAVRQWEFTPTRLNGQPVAVIMTVTVVFSLQ